ncbi:MAG: hypothetical protein GWN97_10620 [Thermoplasmata archaeon]|nr:hypothetical protein [Thermoplasmata archaeon]
MFDQQITQSLDNSQRRQEEYFAAITKLNEDYAKKSDVWAKVRRGIYQEDAHAVVQEEKARAVYQSKVESELAKVQSALKGIRMLTPPEGGAATGAGKKATGGFGMSPGQFRQVSLRRISLVQSARPRAQEQQVHDPAAVAKLEELIQLLSNRKAATAVLG